MRDFQPVGHHITSRIHVMGIKTKFSYKFSFSHLNMVDLVVAKVEDLKLAQAGEQPSPDLKFESGIRIWIWILLLPTFASRL